MDENQNLNNSSVSGELVSPFADSAPSAGNEQLSAPFADVSEPTPVESNAGVWNTFKANLGARVDAVLAAHMQEQGDDRSRYAMQRAQRTNQEAAMKEETLSGIQKTAVMGLDIGTGLAATAVDPAVGLGYFTAQGYADELRNQAAQEDFSRYDTDKALGIGGAQAIAGHLVGPLAGKALGAAAPAIAESAAPTAVKLATRPVTSRLGQAAAGGASTGATMQMISNIGNGRDLMEGVGESAMAGAVGGTMVHAGAGTARTASNIYKRIPVTYEDAKSQMMGRTQRFAQTPEQAPIEEPIAQPTVSAEEGSIPTPEAAPTEPTVAPRAEEGTIPTPPEDNLMSMSKQGVTDERYTQRPGESDQDYMNRVYGQNTAQGGWQTLGGISTPGQQMGPGKAATTGIRMVDRAVQLMNSVRKNGGDIREVIKPQDIKKLTDAELDARAAGVKTDNDYLTRVKDGEMALSTIQRQIDEQPVGSQQWEDAVKAKTEMAAQSGSAAATARATSLMNKVDMPTISMSHNVEFTEGIANQNNPKNLMSDYHGVSHAEAQRGLEALKKSKPIDMKALGAEDINEAQQKYLQTNEAHHNATSEAYKNAKTFVDNTLSENERKIKAALEPHKQLTDPETQDFVMETEQALKDYNSMMTDASNNGGLDVGKLQYVARKLNRNLNMLGIQNELKDINGNKGTFDPVVDYEAWRGFNKRVRNVHSSAPKGQYKEMVEKGEIGLKDIDITKPFSWLKPGQKVVEHAANVYTTGTELARGAKMARAGKASEEAKAAARPQEIAEDHPVSDEHIQEQLREANPEGATASSEAALNRSGIATGDVELGATPAAEAPQRNMASRAQILELARRNHPAAANEDLTREQADFLIAADDHFMRQNQAQPNNEAVAQEASTPARLGEPVQEVPQEVAPEAPVQPPVEVPQEAGAFAQGNERPAQIAPEAAPVESTAPTGQGVPQRPQTRLPEPEVIPQEEPAPVEAPAAPKGEGVPQKPRSKVAEEEGRRPATKAQNQQMEELGIKPEHEISRKAADELISKAKAKAETQETVPEELPTDKPVDLAHTEPKVERGETEAQRNRRVADMAKKMIEKKTEKALNSPITTPKGNAERVKAKQMRQGVSDVIKYSQELSNKLHVPHADVLQAVLNREGGIEATFSNGYGKEAIKGGVNAAVTEYKTKIAKIAKQNVKESRDLVRDRLGEKKVGSTAEEVESLARNNLKSMGYKEEEINAGVSKAQEITERPTVRQIAEATKSIIRENAKAAAKPLNALKDALNTAKMEAKRIKLDVKDATAALEHAKAEAAKSKEAIKESKDKAASRKIYNKDADAVKAATKKLESLQSSQKKADSKVDFHQKNLLDSQLARTKADSDLQAKLKSADEFVTKHEAELTQARTEVKKEMREMEKQMPTEAVEQFGKLIGEDLPDHVTDLNDVNYLSWKDRMEVAADALERRDLHKDAKFLREFSRVVDKGLRRKIELPGAEHQDLIISNKDYRDLMTSFNEARVGREADVKEAGNAHMGTMGTKLGALLLGDSRAEFRLRKFSKTEQGIKAERSKALHKQEAADESGLSSVDIKEKPAPKKTEAAIPIPKEEVKPQPKEEAKPKPVREPEYVKDQRNEKIIKAAQTAHDVNTPQPVYKVARDMTKGLDEGQLTSLIQAIGKAKRANRGASPGSNNYLSALGNEVDRIRKQVRKGK